MTFKKIIRFACAEYGSELNRMVDSLTDDERRFIPGSESHHIDFTVWHMARVEDTWINSFGKQKTQLWDQENWQERLNLNIEMDEPRSGWGWNIDQVHNMPKFSFDVLWDYMESVRECTDQYIEGLEDSDMDMCPDNKRPNYSIAKMLAHLVVEQSQHIGQISYIRGMLRGLDD